LIVDEAANAIRGIARPASANLPNSRRVIMVTSLG
jgi:hypothetical protein